MRWKAKEERREGKRRKGRAAKYDQDRPYLSLSSAAGFEKVLHAWVSHGVRCAVSS